MTVTDQTYAVLPLGVLHEHPRNPREGDVGAIHESIKANGFYGAVVVQHSTGYVLAGNHRLKAARAAGMATLPAIVLDVDDATALRILLADNRANDLATYRESELASVLLSLDDLTGTLYSDDDLQALIAKANDPLDFDEDEPEAKTTTCPECGHEFVKGAK